MRVVLVDDHTVARHGIRLMLAGADDLEVVGEADTAAAALTLARTQTFDVALLDISLPDKNGLELLKQLREQQPGLAVLIVSMYAEDVYALRALKLGAAGYLTKTCSSATLIEAVRKAAGGGKYVSPALLQKLAGMLGGGPGGVLHEALTDRELEIFRMIASGESLVGIAAALHLSPSTVTTYRSRVLDKMGMKSNAELTRYGLDHGLLG
ncbi:response regulator transcription factor [Massilia sp. CCM 9210]|uniref:response regulator n=1 Tax=Massilia scottii TaxID=3057166 RepID=UPI00279656A0|nr:response regulator transcription factor [Massilia sp. CCM 9210]MDQ1812187.1 response regulator transcription factor [Massilia sp. CCM 9210]